MSRLMAVLALTVAACASQQKKPAALAKNGPAFSTSGQAAPQGRELCHMERDTGSNIMQKVCVWRDADDDARRETQDAMMRLQQSGAQGVNPHGGG